MIIVSQDKEEVINFENILSVKLFHDDEDNECLYEIYTTVNAPGDNYILLGEYSTEKRAEEVLQEIAYAYANVELLKIPKMDFKEVVTSKQFGNLVKYEMPKE